MKKKTIALALLLFGAMLMKGFSQEKDLYMVADAHFDTQWNWTVQTSIADYLKRTFENNFALIDKYPDYKFNFEGAIKYMWLKEYYPDVFNKLKGYVANGRWHLSGSSLDANDVITPSPESVFRNILLGQTFYKREFGIKSTDIFLPDCFGFGYSLPTIATHCGLIGFSTQKLIWGAPIIPFKIGVWQGVDGSKIMAVANAEEYGYNITNNLTNDQHCIDLVNETGSKSGHYVGYKYFGTGDTGGSPSDASVSMLESSIASNGTLKVKCMTSDYLFNQYKSNYNDFQQYNGELLMTSHGNGCYTSQTMMKRWNRKNELLGDAAERSSVIASWLGGQNYPAAELNDIWTKVIWHQFHDDLTGTSIPQAYNFSWNDEVICQNKFSNVLQNAVGAGARALNTQTTGTPVVVYNPLSIDRDDIVEATLKMSTNYVKVFNKSGVEIPSQVTSNNSNGITFIFVASVKSLSYEVFDVQAASSASAGSNELKVSTGSLENAAYNVTINSNGDVSSIVDKQNGNRQLLNSPVRLAMFDDQSNDWPAWEIKEGTLTASPQNYVDQNVSVTVVENGPVRVSLKITRDKKGSNFTQYVRLTTQKRRVDFDNEVDWNSMATFLKAVFPLNVSNPSATYDLGLGVIKRGNNYSKLYEVPAQQWADITNTDNSYGVSILNDCKYGWDKPSDNTLRMSLIRSPGSVDRFHYQVYQDLGNNKFSFSIFAHNNTCLEASSTWEAARLNQPLLAFETTKHDGNLGKNFSFVGISSNQVALKECKKAENSSNYVLRFYETKGTNASNVKITFPADITSAKELNGIEEEIGGATYSGNTLTISMGAFQPKTFSVTMAAPTTTLVTPTSSPLGLSYTDDVITSDADRTNGSMDGDKNSYSAELLPDNIVSDGISFSINRQSGNNVIRCKGNSITLPDGYKKVYILAASSNKAGSQATFMVNNTPSNFNIPYFSQFVGAVTRRANVDNGTFTSAGYFKKENIAWAGDHMHNGTKNIDVPYIYTYLFKYCIELPAGTKTLTLPTNDSIAVFAITMANNANDDTKPAIELRDIPKQDKSPVTPVSNCGVLLSQGKTATASGQTGTAEGAPMAVDGNPATKWCQNVAGPKWLQVDLGENKVICGWKVFHAGSESLGSITGCFRLQYLNGTTWVSADVVLGNTDNITDRAVNQFVARYVRLYIDNTGTDDASRILEFQVFGTAGSCLPIQPYLNINNSGWQQSTIAELNTGGTVSFGPQSGDGTWKWTGPNGFTSTAREITLSNIQSNQGGTYTATYTSPAGCTSSQNFVVSLDNCAATAIVSYLNINNTTWQQTAAATVGAGGSVTFGPQPADGTWKWAGPNGFTSNSREITISNIQTNQVGTYQATYYNANGCTSTKSFTISLSCTATPIVPYLVVNGGAWQQTATATLNSGGSLSFGPQPLDGTWNWTGPNGFTSNAREFTLTNIQSAQAGQYKASYTNTNGCATTMTFNVNLLKSGKIEAETANDQKIVCYPNPATDEIVLTNIPANSMISVFDMNGRALLNTKSSNESGDIKIDTSTLNTGVYYIKISNKESMTLKLLKY